MAVLAEPVSVRHTVGEKQDLIYSLLKLSLSQSVPGIIYEQATEPINEAKLVSEVAGDVDAKVTSIITITNKVSCHAESVERLSEDLDSISQDIRQELSQFKLA